MSDLGGDLGRLSAQSSDVIHRFYDEAGAARSWDDYMKSRVSGALGGDEGALSDVRGYLTAEYAGPEGLGTEEVGRLQQDLSEMYGTAGRIGSGYDLTPFMQEMHPGLSPGMARFEAQREAPELMQTGQEIARGAGQERAKLGPASEAAEQYAAERAEQEAGIRSGAEESLRGEQSSLAAALQARAEEENAKAAAMDKALQTFYSTGDWAVLEPWLGTGVAASSLGRLSEAQAKAEELWDDPQYESIKDIPLARMVVLRKGNTDLLVTLPNGVEVSLWQLKEGKVSKKKTGLLKAEQKALGELLEQRQQAFEMLFSPQTSRSVWPGMDRDRVLPRRYIEEGVITQDDPVGPGGRRGLSELEALRTGTIGGRGLYADVLPMYSDFLQLPEGYGLPYEITGQWAPFPGMPNPSTLISLEGAPIATEQNVATPEEQEQMRLIAELLGATAPEFSERTSPQFSGSLQDILSGFGAPFGAFTENLTAAERAALYPTER
ncbi:MAG: hypothetical protein JW940_21570 [Polyangiaceae bacterium]|nr:hypothetical protein [Polyangiaceae bacterium]